MTQFGVAKHYGDFIPGETEPLWLNVVINGNLTRPQIHVQTEDLELDLMTIRLWEHRNKFTGCLEGYEIPRTPFWTLITSGTNGFDLPGTLIRLVTAGPSDVRMSGKMGFKVVLTSNQKASKDRFPYNGYVSLLDRNRRELGRLNGWSIFHPEPREEAPTIYTPARKNKTGAWSQMVEGPLVATLRTMFEAEYARCCPWRDTSKWATQHDCSCDECVYLDSDLDRARCRLNAWDPIQGNDSPYMWYQFGEAPTPHWYESQTSDDKAALLANAGVIEERGKLWHETTTYAWIDSPLFDDVPMSDDQLVDLMTVAGMPTANQGYCGRSRRDRGYIEEDYAPDDEELDEDEAPINVRPLPSVIQEMTEDEPKTRTVTVPVWSEAYYADSCMIATRKRERKYMPPEIIGYKTIDVTEYPFDEDASQFTNEMATEIIEHLPEGLKTLMRGRLDGPISNEDMRLFQWITGPDRCVQHDYAGRASYLWDDLIRDRATPCMWGVNMTLDGNKPRYWGNVNVIRF